MSSAAGTTREMHPPCMELIGKLDERSCFIPNLQKSIYCKFNILLAEAQQKVEKSLEDLTKKIGMSVKAVDKYSFATKELAEAREQARKGWWQQLKQVAVNAVRRKESLAPELHKIATDTCQEFLTLWRCFDSKNRAREFWYHRDENAQRFSRSLTKVVDNQKTLKRKGVITETLDLSEFGIQERLISDFI